MRKRRSATALRGLPPIVSLGPEPLNSTATALNRCPAVPELVEGFRNRQWPLDTDFDSFLPQQFQTVSSRYWTPLVVAAHAAICVEQFNIRTVVDIGSGVGKFCVVAALTCQTECRFIGLEQRPRLVSAARQLATQFGVDHRVAFLEGALGTQAVPAAEAYYLFNPFGENVFCAGAPLDSEVELSRSRMERDVDLVEELLRCSPVGQFLLTYHGFGGTVPDGYVQLRAAGESPHLFGLWKKES